MTEAIHLPHLGDKRLEISNPIQSISPLTMLHPSLGGDFTF